MLRVGYTHVMLVVSVKHIVVFYNSAHDLEHLCFVILSVSEGSSATSYEILRFTQDDKMVMFGETGHGHSR